MLHGVADTFWKCPENNENKLQHDVTCRDMKTVILEVAENLFSV